MEQESEDVKAFKPTEEDLFKKFIFGESKSDNNLDKSEFVSSQIMILKPNSTKKTTSKLEKQSVLDPTAEKDATKKEIKHKTEPIKIPQSIDDFKLVYLKPQNQIKCLKCDVYFITKNSRYYRHLRKEHKDQNDSGSLRYGDPHTCIICNKTLYDRQNLQLHMFSIHRENNLESKFKCQICSQNFFSQGLHNLHVKRVHENTEQINCHICNKLFVRPSTLKKHVRIVHEMLKPFQCPHCPKSFGLKWTQAQHTATVHLKIEPFQCSICLQRFSQPAHLKDHTIQIHTNIRAFECKTFFSLILLCKDERTLINY